MYGNYYDYGDPDLTDLRSATKDIMTDTRDAVSSISSAGTDIYEKVSAGMGDRLKDVGVGGVKSYLNSAYKPFLNDTTTDYRTFMADTPQKIQDNINATNVAYNAGRADRTRGFQDLLKEVKAFTYSADNYKPASNPGPGAQAPAAPAAPPAAPAPPGPAFAFGALPLPAVPAPVAPPPPPPAFPPGVPFPPLLP